MGQASKESIIRRLIILKQVYFHACQYALDRTEIGRAFAIQVLDYCIETLLKTTVSKYGPPSDYRGLQSGYYYKTEALRNQKYSPKMDFYRLWDEVVGIFRDPNKGIGIDELPLRREIGLLHKLRNGVQHDGVIPSGDEVQKRVAYVESFIRDVFQTAFGKKFDEIVLANLIENDEIRNFVGEAEKALEEERFKDSIIASAKAFRTASLMEKRRAPYRRWLSGPFILFDIERMGERIPGGREAFRDLGGVLEEIREGLEYLEEQLEVISLTGDLRRYLRFKQKSPHLRLTMSGDFDVQTTQKWEPTKDDAIEVLDFVFGTILGWQSIPFEEEDAA